MSGLALLELEITGRCQLYCVHCYSSSGPNGTHGSMQMSDWLATIDQAAELGVSRVQLIGGEPTLHPGLPQLVRHSLEYGLEVEVYSNLVRMTPAMWELFALPGVRLASSYYSDDADEHNTVTQRPTHHRTLTNIQKALELGIPIRVAVIEVGEGQGVEAAQARLRALGVERIDFDRMRQIGRGVRDGRQGVDQLCGLCGDGRMAVLPSGQAVPCVLSRWLTLGAVREVDLGTLYARAQNAHEEITAVVMPPKKCPPPCPPPQCPPPKTGCPPPKGDDPPPPTCMPPLRRCPPPPG